MNSQVINAHVNKAAGELNQGRNSKSCAILLAAANGNENVENKAMLDTIG